MIEQPAGAIGSLQEDSCVPECHESPKILLIECRRDVFKCGRWFGLSAHRRSDGDGDAGRFQAARPTL
jgi:hypothetical protein